ncbi:MAG: hypothetical protein Ct9H300mP7_0520 [Verrucomicrobiota bacterium]|nr:MAG: hypothetical protein Ct9H300mP7_0520 [Verrucomicrobiota bacterium]
MAEHSSHGLPVAGKRGPSFGRVIAGAGKSDKGTTSHDMHATILDLLGVNHEKLTVRHNGMIGV